jgi:hypothetical protein
MLALVSVRLQLAALGCFLTTAHDLLFSRIGVRVTRCAGRSGTDLEAASGVSFRAAVTSAVESEKCFRRYAVDNGTIHGGRWRWYNGMKLSSTTSGRSLLSYLFASSSGECRRGSPVWIERAMALMRKIPFAPSRSHRLCFMSTVVVQFNRTFRLPVVPLRAFPFSVADQNCKMRCACLSV